VQDPLHIHHRFKMALAAGSRLWTRSTISLTSQLGNNALPELLNLQELAVTSKSHLVLMQNGGAINVEMLLHMQESPAPVHLNAFDSILYPHPWYTYAYQAIIS